MDSKVKYKYRKYTFFSIYNIDKCVLLKDNKNKKVVRF